MRATWNVEIMQLTGIAKFHPNPLILVPLWLDIPNQMIPWLQQTWLNTCLLCRVPEHTSNIWRYAVLWQHHQILVLYLSFWMFHPHFPHNTSTIKLLTCSYIISGPVLFVAVSLQEIASPVFQNHKTKEWTNLDNITFSFDCTKRPVGFYADMEYNCQVILIYVLVSKPQDII